jgi:quinol monooxygenase YgiN
LPGFTPALDSRAKCIRPCTKYRRRRARNPAASVTEAFIRCANPDEFYIHTRWRDMAAFERHAELPHTLRFVETVEPLLDHPFKITLAEQLW